MTERSSPDIELLPCPFCGKRPAECILEDEPGSPASAWINCSCGVETCERPTLEAATAHWNTRASLQPATPPATGDGLRHMHDSQNGDHYVIDAAGNAYEPATPTAGWTEGDVALFAARMRGIGLMKPQAYGQIEHDLVRKLLQEFPRFAPATGGDAVAGDAEAGALTPGEVSADFHAYWDVHQKCPEHSLIAENAANATWHAAYAKYTRDVAGDAKAAALERARDAIASLPIWAMGGATVEHSDGAGTAYDYPIRDELLAAIDAALRSDAAGGVHD